MSKQLMERIFVTGSGGFIGKRLVDELKRKGHEVIEYDIQQGKDICNFYLLSRAMAESESGVVIHLAARAGVGDSLLYPDEYISTNIKGTYNVVEACKRNNIKRLIFFSSSSVLGGNKDGDEMGLSENSLFNPFSLYGITKMTGEKLVMSSGLHYVIIRPFTVYGESGRPDMVIYKWIKSIKEEGVIRLYGNGDSCRGYTYVGDLVDGILSLILFLRDKKLKDFIFHLGGEERITIATLSAIFQKFCTDNNIELRAEYLPLQDWDVKKSFANINLAKRLLGFKQSKKFEEIINSILKKELL